MPKKLILGSLGLESTALQILDGNGVVDSAQCVLRGLGSLIEALLGIQHIIADVISKDKDY